MKTPNNAPDIKVGHKTHDEIKKGLECCSNSDGTCEGCPYVDGECRAFEQLSADALAIIQQLEFQNGELLKTVEMLKAEIEEYEESADKCCYESRCNAELNKLEDLCKRLMDDKEQLEDHLREATKMVEQLEAERDAAVSDILYAASVYLGECETCKNGEVCAACKRQDACDECPNSKCMCSGCGVGRSNWQWRGVQKEATP